MKILFLYKYLSEYNLDEHLHLEFVKYFKNTEHQVDCYGPNIKKAYPEICSTEYDANLTLADLRKNFNFDVIICITKARMFMDYSPPTRANYMKGCILPSDFKTINVPKIVLEEDYHYEINDDWYFEQGIDLIMNRHLVNSLREGKVKKKWVPFSVDTNKFLFTKNHSRKNRIAFAGSISPPYPDRIFAINTLEKHKLIDSFASRQKLGRAYIECLQDYVCHLSGASAYDICAAKNFEITSCGAVLLTNNFTGLEQLFNKESYVLWNESNLLDKVNEILNDQELVHHTVNSAYRDILNRHTHEKRIAEIVDIIKSI